MLVDIGTFSTTDGADKRGDFEKQICRLVRKSTELQPPTFAARRFHLGWDVRFLSPRETGYACGDAYPTTFGTRLCEFTAAAVA